MAPVAALAVLETRSEAFKRLESPTAIRAGRFLLAYDPAGRTLDVISGDDQAPADYHFSAPDLPASDDPPLEMKLWLARRNEPAAFWRALPEFLRAPSEMSRFDRLLFALALHRLPADRIRPAHAPLAPAAGPEPSPILAEVLNASDRKGLASEAAKVLRSKGIDVVASSNAKPSARTVVYDRTGRFETAAKVARLLGCGAEPVTQINLNKVVDVTIVLSEDCDPKNARRLSWNWWKS
jgi:hypothetical protein